MSATMASFSTYQAGDRAGLAQVGGWKTSCPASFATASFAPATAAVIAPTSPLVTVRD